MSFGAGWRWVRDRCRDSQAPRHDQPGDSGGVATSELNLDSEQQEQMKKIWSETAGRSGGKQDEHAGRYARIAMMRSSD